MSSKGKHWKLSEVTKTKMSLSRIGLKNSLGYKFSEEAKQKMSINRKINGFGKWNKGKKHTEEHNIKIGISSKGRVQTLQTRLKHSIALKGKKKTLEHRLKITGKNHYNWKGGITKLKIQIRNTVEYYEWRFSIYKRDNFTCCSCNKVGKKLNAHHIISLKELLEKNKIKTVEQAIKCQELWNIENGVTLCEDCHKLTDGYGVFKQNNLCLQSHIY